MKAMRTIFYILYLYLIRLFQRMNPKENTLHEESFAGCKIRKVADNIHDFIYLPELFWRFIDTPAFQRLRNIKQLSCLYYVFPGATHTRFEHCIGTAHLARKYILSLIANHPQLYLTQTDKYDAELTVTLAGLLHDIGHGPFSHTFEHGVLPKLEINIEGKSHPWDHELAGTILFQHILKSEKDLNEIVTPARVRRVIALIKGDQTGDNRPWQFDLIHNQRTGIDVDKLDYFRRDAFYLGAKKIFIEHDLLMSESKVFLNQICFPSKYVDNVNDIFHSRYKLYKNFYTNNIFKGIELMVLKVLSLIKDKFQFEHACRQICEEPQLYMSLSESILQQVEPIERIMKSDDPEKEKFREAVTILNRIKRRKHYKFVGEKHFYLFDYDGTDHKWFLDIGEFFSEGKIIAHIISKGIPQKSFAISKCESGFGLKTENAMRKVRFFDKESACPLADSNKRLSMLISDPFLERSFKLYCTEYDTKDKKLVSDAIDIKEAFDSFWVLEQTIHFMRSHNITLLEGDLGKTTLKFEKQNQVDPSSRGLSSQVFDKLPKETKE